MSRPARRRSISPDVAPADHRPAWLTRLAAGVVWRALQDAQGLTAGERPRHRAEIIADARAWLAGPDAEAFAVAAGLPVEAVRAWLAQWRDAA